MNKFFTVIMLSVMAILLGACSKVPPKCSDDNTLELVKKAILDQIGGSKVFFQENMKIESPIASSFDENIKRYNCEAKLDFSMGHKLPITYASQLDDKGQHIVSVVETRTGDFLYVKSILDDLVNLYFTPTQVYNKETPQGISFRIGGLVEEGSVKREKDGLTVHFMITDLHKKLPVVYKGILPDDLFKEGKGVVAQGKIEADGVMHAEEVAARQKNRFEE